jgi:hypothetical protein
VLQEYPDLAERFVVLVDEPTSRDKKGAAANNYDHFVLSSDLHAQEYVEDSAERYPAELLLDVEAKRGATISDHFPIRARFRSGGTGADGRPVKRDGKPICSLAG